MTPGLAVEIVRVERKRAPNNSAGVLEWIVEHRKEDLVIPPDTSAFRFMKMPILSDGGRSMGPDVPSGKLNWINCGRTNCEFSPHP